MDTSNYTFLEMRSSEFKVDPVFKTKDFVLFGDPASAKETPLLFHVTFNNRFYIYCLVEPNSIVKDDIFLLKIKRYLIIREDNDDSKGFINAYFIGNMKKSVDVSSDFTNQTIQLVTYDMVEQWYPKKLSDVFRIVISHVLKNQKHLGQHNFMLQIDDDHLFVNPHLTDLEKRDYKLYILKCMKEEGLASIIAGSFYIDCFDLTAKAVDMVESETSEVNNIAFIAIKFDNNAERINAIQSAIAIAGFEPRIMSHFETNNWIMPEIFFQIKNSKFVVADFSLPCDGAYYEAGYAAALKKPVIHLFDKREECDTNRLHFDIAQKSTIFYSDFDDLKNRLINRIKATIK